MNKEKIMVWGRELELEVKFDCYSGEQVLDSQKRSVDLFVKAEEGIAASLSAVKEYCLKSIHDEIGADTIDNIFKYVAPKYLYVVRDNSKRVVAIMCNYKFDSENGIAVVFENEQFKKIGKQDIIL